MNFLIAVLGVLVGITIIMALVIGLGGLVAWGIGNGIIFLFGLTATWTYLHGCITAFVLWGIGWLIKMFIRKGAK